MAALPVLALLFLLCWGGPQAAGQKRKEVRYRRAAAAARTGTGWSAVGSSLRLAPGTLRAGQALSPAWGVAAPGRG